jgi:hypothetical protein
VADAAQTMQDQLDKLQQAANDGTLAQNGQDGQDGQGGQNQGNGAGGNENGGQQAGQPNNGQGEFAQGDPKGNQGGGSGGPGVSAGGPRPAPTEAPFGVVPDKAPSQTDPNGKILASSFVKAVSKKGGSTLAPREVIDSSVKEAADEVTNDRVSRPAQNAVKKYFDNLKEGIDQPQPAQ